MSLPTPDDENIGEGSGSLTAARTAAVRILSYALGFVASVVITRVLGPTGRGQYYVIVTIATVTITVAHLSIEQANLYHWPSVRLRPILLGNSLLIAGISGTIAAVIAGIVVLGPASGWVPVTNATLLWVGLVAVPGNIAVRLLGGMFVADGRLWPHNKGEMLAAVVQTALLLGLAAIGRLGVGEVVGIWGLSVTLPLVAYIPSMWRKPGMQRPELNVVISQIALGLRYHLGIIAVQFVFRVDVLMLNAMTSDAAVGLYSLAVTMAEATFLITQATAQTAASTQLDESPETFRYTARMIRTNAVLSTILVACLVLVSPVAVPFVFGRDFAESVPPLVALAPGIIALSTVWPLGVFINRRNRPGLVSTVAISALALNVLLNLALINPLGIIGAGLASTVTYSGMLAFHVAWFLRHSGLRATELRPEFSDIWDPLAAIWRKLRRR